MSGVVWGVVRVEYSVSVLSRGEGSNISVPCFLCECFKGQVL